MTTIYDKCQWTNGNPFETEQLVLSSLELFLSQPEIQRQALAAGWDLVAIDEAHHLHWSQDSVGADYLFVEALARQTAGLLLLTATPEQIGQASHFARLRLLDPTRFHDLQQFQQEEMQYRKWSELADALEKGQKLEELPAGLDPAARRAAWDLIRGIRDGGATVVLVTHLHG